MSNLFGIDIQSLVTDVLAGQLLPITLTRTVEGSYDPLTDTQTTTEQTYATEGIEENRTKFYEAGLTTATEIPILMLSKPLGTHPKQNDLLTIDGNTYTVTGILDRDPAGATYTVKVEI